jgi:hypothetical protein
MSDAGVVMRPERPRRPVLMASLVALVLLGGGMLLLGIPGAIYMGPAVPIVELLRGMPQGSLFRGDAAWPTAILLTLLVPPLLPVLLWLGLRLFLRRLWPALFVSLVGLWLWAILLLLGLSAGL